ncbi:MAG: sugar ABC transporter ATP-binding protein [Armatimonadota bacterium]|nr:sugar ABC transporter ATP-binding protein [Armatimonadota bacterium]
MVSQIPNSSADSLALDVRGVVKTFPGVRALDRVDFDLRRGEVHALVGENGAGKSTLMHIIGGVYQPEDGSVTVEGQDVRFAQPHDAARHGIAVVFQELSVSDNLSIAENIFANRQPVRFGGLVDWGSLYSQAREQTALFGWEIDPMTPVGELSSAKKQVVEILKAISQRPKVLVLDEPTSSLTSVEVEMLFRNVRRLREEGLSIIYISHHLIEIFELADRVTVLRDGRKVETCDVKDVTEDDLVRKMVGRELVDMYGKRETEVGGEHLRVENACLAGSFEAVDLVALSGEIIGLAGLAGAGRTQLGRSIFGDPPPDSGRIYLDGEPVNIASPGDAIRHGIGYVSEDRKEEGLFLDMSVRENCAAPALGGFAGSFGLMNENAITRFAEDCRDRFGIVTPSVWHNVRQLSGGNQQKTLLAMWTGVKPRLLIADEPTRGVDVGAKSEIYHLLRRLAAEGVTVILISSDLTEILGLSDRVLVMRNGRIAAEFAGKDATEEGIIACATGLSADRGAATTNGEMG